MLDSWMANSVKFDEIHLQNKTLKTVNNTVILTFFMVLIIYFYIYFGFIISRIYWVPFIVTLLY
jgi:hypothetical protein